MWRSTRVAGACTAMAALLSTSALSGLSVALPNASGAADVRDVIIILRDQMPGLPAVRGARQARASALAASQAPIVSDLQRSGTSKIRSFALINAVAATVSQAEADHLATHPLVQAVVADHVIRIHRPLQRLPITHGGMATSLSVAAAPTGASDLCNTLEPEALQLTRTAYPEAGTPQSQSVLDGHGKPVMGNGVRVAFLADAMDPTITGFVRPDGTSVFFDYQDFTGDAPGTPTGGAEGFGDASSIAAQDMPNGKSMPFDLSQFVTSAHPLPSPCNIHIRGVAPGASLAGLTVFSSQGLAPESVIVQAIEWAVAQDDVDVINESFGGAFYGAFYPDNVNDPVSLANQAAVQAGVTVVVATGDAGSASTLQSPASDPYVIAAGASTQFRSYAQSASGVLPIAHGFVSGNVSALSSSGLSQSGARTVDVLAPGDLGWALCSTNIAVFTECTNYATLAGLPSPIQLFGGTSEAAPLTSGEAALVIQAYRSTHGGASPSPALIKQIIMSTAIDLGAPSYEQGAGLINTLGAVRAALSIHDTQGAPKSRGAGLLNAPTSISITAEPGTREEKSITITNTGSAPRHLTPALERLGAPIAGANVSLHLSTEDSSYLDAFAIPQPYITYRFKVPAGAQHLDAAIAFAVPPIVPYGFIDFALLDPSGRQAAYSIPQGLSGYSHIDVVKPVPGEWTAVISTFGGVDAQYGYTGAVQLSWSAERYEEFGSLEPSSADLAAGASKTFKASFAMPSDAGDISAALKFEGDDSDAEFSDIPVSLRSMIPMSSTGGEFTGTLTGTNGRSYMGGPTQTFVFAVPKGLDNMNLNLEVSDNSYQLQGVLVDPNGMPLSVQGNLDPSGNPQYGMQLSRANPQSGIWRFLLIDSYNESGTQTSLPFTARIGFNQASVTATGLPNDPSIKLSASGAPIKIPVTIVNTGPVAEAFFADARLTELTSMTLAALPFSTTALPGAYGFFNVPTGVTTIRFIEKASAPITMDAFNISGYDSGQLFSPDITGQPSAKGTESVAALNEPQIPNGEWQTVPALKGPFGSSGALPATVTSSVELTLKAFDTAVTADSGNLWADFVFGTSTYQPLIVGPGASGVITLTLSPDAAKVGTVVTGYLYVDTFNSLIYNGDEVVRIPYQYTVAP